MPIAGGKRVEKWRRTAKHLGLAGRVSFVGTIANLVPYYAAADAYVHPTYYDPCSLVLLEAAASGLPIVTTRRYNGAVELFREDEEILVADDPTASNALYERVDALFDDRFAPNSAPPRAVLLYETPSSATSPKSCASTNRAAAEVWQRECRVPLLAAHR